MSKNAKKYSDEQITEVVARSYSIRAVLIELGMSESGGSRQHLNRRIKLLNLDTSHFSGRSHNKGKASPRRKHWSQKLVLRTEQQGKESGRRLARALIESGVPYRCNTEGCPTRTLDFWGEMKLEVDHIDGNNLDNRQENLRFLCPNCHANEPTSSHSWKKAVRFGTKTICQCGGQKDSRSETCSQCYDKTRRSKVSSRREGVSEDTRKFCSCGNGKKVESSICWECDSRRRQTNIRPRAKSSCACGNSKNKASQTCRECYIKNKRTPVKSDTI